MASGRFREDLYYTALRYTRLHCTALHCTTATTYNLNWKRHCNIVQLQLQLQLHYATLDYNYTTLQPKTLVTAIVWIHYIYNGETSLQPGHGRVTATMQNTVHAWKRSSFIGSPPLLRGRRGTMCIAKGSDVRPGVPWVSASFAWQAWDNVHCQGVGCTGSDVRPGVPWAPPLLRGRRGTMLFCVALTHSLPHSLTDSLTHSFTHSLTHLCMHIHTHMLTNSPTITTPSLLYFLFPSCFSMLSLSLKKLVTCGVIRSYNLEWLLWLQWSPHPQLLDVVWCSAVVIVVWCSGVVVEMCDMCSVAAVAVVIVVWCN